MAHSKIAVISANFGGFDPYTPPVEQSVKHDTFFFSEENFPLRHCALTPRLQARLVKCFAWQMVPGYDYYLWHDSSIQLGHEDTVRWYLSYAQGAEMAVMKHPHRNTIGEEAEYVKRRIEEGNEYLTSRYENELIDEQMKEINNPDLELYASTVFIYRPTYTVKNAMKEWWYHISRYHIIDQLSLPHALNQQVKCMYAVIPDNFYNTPYLKHVR